MSLKTDASAGGGEKSGKISAVLQIQRQVLSALILREMQTRFGRSNIGYLWALVEPLTVLVVFWGVFVMIGRQVPGGMSVVPFLATGIMVFLTFRSTSNRLSNAIDANRGLLLYPQVTPFDLMMGRAMLEGATFLVLFSLIIGGAWMMGLSPLPAYPLALLGTLIAIQVLACGIGMVLGTLTALYPIVDHFMKPVWRVALFVSGVFYTMDELPPALLDFIRYNPIAHAIDLLRGTFFVGYTPKIASPAYVAGWLVVSLFLGLALERMTRHRTRVQ